MKSALAIGGRVVPVEVVLEGEEFCARCEFDGGAGKTKLTGRGESFDAALLSLRNTILAQAKSAETRCP